MNNLKKLENLKAELFSQKIDGTKVIIGGFCCTIAGGKNTNQDNGTTVWDCPKESFSIAMK